MKIKKNKDAISEIIENKTYVLNINTGYYIELNETASELWASFENHTTLEDLEKYLLNNYDLSSEQAKKDVNFFINDCINNSLVLVIEK